MSINGSSSRAYWIDIARIIAITMVVEVYSHAFCQRHLSLLLGAAASLFFFEAVHFNEGKAAYGGCIMFVCACLLILTPMSVEDVVSEVAATTQVGLQLHI